MSSNKYSEFDMQRNPPNQPELQNQQNPYSQQNPMVQHQAMYQQPIPPNFYPMQNPPVQNISPIIQQQAPAPLSYGIPIDMRQNVRTVPTTRNSENLFCFNCQRVVPTQVTFTAGAGTWTSVLIVAMVGCFLGCCLIPFCIEECQDAKHVCSSCGCELGKKRFLFS